MSYRIQCLLFSVVLMAAAGCSDLNLFRFQSPDEDKQEEPLTKVLEESRKSGKTPLIGDYTTISGYKMVVLEGVGLVTKLDGTGGDCPSSSFRKTLLDNMRKWRVKEPNKVLQSPATALVVVRAFLPPLMKKGDTFDVEVRFPDGSEATSLAGGWLLKCDLAEQAVVDQGVLQGEILAKAEGPILIAGDGEDGSSVAMVKRGTIPGGATYLREERNLTMYLKSDYRSVRMANRIANKIGERFHDFDEYGIRRPLAEPETDTRIVLRVHPTYSENDARYMECIRHIAFNETQVERHLRIQRLKQELQQGPTALEAAIQLEAIGPAAIPVLKEALTAPSFESRFHAAEALAYLKDGSGVDVLAEGAGSDRAFRVFAFAAMAALPGGDAHAQLTELMNHPSIETRYGAFRALTTLNPNDATIPGKELNKQFKLHVVESSAEPLIHITRRRLAEIVLFGPDQRFRLPMTVKAGQRIWLTSPPGTSKLVLSRYEAGEKDQRHEVEPRIADVIEAVTAMGASYPDVVQMLMQAERQHNLPGQIAIDALPQAGRIYYREAEGDLHTTAPTHVGNRNLSPGLFSATEEDPDTEAPYEETPAAASSTTGNEPATPAAEDSPPVPVEPAVDTR